MDTATSWQLVHDGAVTRGDPSEWIITVFRSRLRPGAEPDYLPLAKRMLTLASAMPGFVDFKSFTADDGERVSIVIFADAAAHDAWRDHPEHVAAQRRGKSDLYESFDISVSRCESRRSFPP